MRLCRFDAGGGASVGLVENGAGLNYGFAAEPTDAATACTLSVLS